MNLHWATADACGGVLYGPYSRREAFDIQEEADYSPSPCDRQDVFLVFVFRDRYFRLLRFKANQDYPVYGESV